MTERLYYTDAYLRSFDARIVHRASDGRTIYLDRTAFYPTSGGQPFDTGTLGGVAVTDVVDEGERIAHVLVAAAPGGDTVHGEIDWTRRFDNMQQHTGQHLLSAIFADRFKLETVSVHFGAESSTLDLDTESLSPKTLLEAERLANAATMDPHAVGVSFESAATATGLRKPPPREGALRVVSINALDRSACGGTHVRSTAEVGAILLRGTERVRKATRVEFLCGLRAVRAARADHELVSALALSLGVGPSELVSKTKALSEELRAAQAERRTTAERVGRVSGPRDVRRSIARLDWNAAHRGPASSGIPSGASALFGSPTLEELRSLAQAAIALVMLASSERSDRPRRFSLPARTRPRCHRRRRRPQAAPCPSRWARRRERTHRPGTVPSPDALDAIVAAL